MMQSTSRLPIVLGALLAGLLVAFVAAHALRSGARKVDPAPGSSETIAALSGSGAGERSHPGSSSDSPTVAPLNGSAAVGAPSAPSDQAAAAPAAGDSALADRDRQVAAVRESGPDSKGLLRTTSALSRAWEKLMPRGAEDVNVGAWECHRAGCFVDVLQKSDAAMEDLTSKILASPDLVSWSGQWTRSAPVHAPDGSVKVTWIVMAAEDEGARSAAR